MCGQVFTSMGSGTKNETKLELLVPHHGWMERLTLGEDSLFCGRIPYGKNGKSLPFSDPANCFMNL